MEKVALYVQALDLSKTWLEKKVENPETGRMVKVKSLSPELQKQYRPKSHEKAIQHDKNKKLTEVNKKIDFHKQHALHHYDEIKKHIDKHNAVRGDSEDDTVKREHITNKYNNHLNQLSNHVNKIKDLQETHGSDSQEHKQALSEVLTHADHAISDEPRKGINDWSESLPKLHKSIKDFKKLDHKIKTR